MKPMFSEKEYIALCANCGDWTTYSKNRSIPKILCQFCRSAKRPCLSKKFRQAVIDLFGGVCYYCRKPADCVDHLIPVSRGGTEDADNLVAACNACNSKKGSKTVHEYSRYLAA